MGTVAKGGRAALDLLAELVDKGRFRPVKVVRGILDHLGLPTTARALARSRGSLGIRSRRSAGSTRPVLR